MRVIFFPYHGEENPYQYLIKMSILENSKGTIDIEGVKPKKILPHFAFSSKIDVLHHFWPDDFYKGRNLLISFFKKLQFLLWIFWPIRYKLIYSADNIFSHKKKVLFVDWFFRWLLLRKADRIIVSCEIAKNRIIEVFGKTNYKKIAVVAHPTYQDYYPSTMLKENARDVLSLSQKHKVILHFGRLCRYKGIIGIIIAFEKANCENTILILAGKIEDDALRFEIKELIKNNSKILLFDEEVDNNDIQLFMAASDVCIFNFLDEPFNSGSVILSLSFGRPIIAPLVSSLNEFSQMPFFTGFKHRDEDDLAKAIKNFSLSRNDQEEAASINSYLMNNHSIKKIGDLYNRIYSN